MKKRLRVLAVCSLLVMSLTAASCGNAGTEGDPSSSGTDSEIPATESENSGSGNLVAGAENGNSGAGNPSAGKENGDSEAGSGSAGSGSSSQGEAGKVYTAADVLAPLGFDVAEYVTLPEGYQDMEIERGADREATEEDVQEMLKAFVAMYPYVSTDSGREKVTPDTITDQWVKENFSAEGCTTIEQLKEYLRDYINTANESQNNSIIEDTIFGRLMEEGDVTIPEGYLEKRIDLYKENVYHTVEESGKSFEERMGVTEKEFLDSIAGNMETRVRKELILEALVKDLDIRFTQSEIDDYMYTYMTTYGYQEKEDMFRDLGRLSELSGEDYLKLGYAEHQAWYKLRQMVLK